MAAPPAGWTITPLGVDPEANTVQFAVKIDPSIETDFAFGCRICGRSLKNDEVEFCDTVMGTVHCDCHDLKCRKCSWLLCTPERCNDIDECDECGAPRCRRHAIPCSCA
jgi:hypothetical protein